MGQGEGGGKVFHSKITPALQANLVLNYYNLTSYNLELLSCILCHAVVHEKKNILSSDLHILYMVYTSQYIK